MLFLIQKSRQEEKEGKDSLLESKQIKAAKAIMIIPLIS